MATAPAVGLTQQERQRDERVHGGRGHGGARGRARALRLLATEVLSAKLELLRCGASRDALRRGEGGAASAGAAGVAG